MTVGVVVTGRSLKDGYDAYFAQVLGDYLQALPRRGKEHQKYQVLKELPDKDGYNDLRTKRFTTTVDTLIEDAYSTIEELASEMQEAYDNMPESLQGGDVGKRRQEAADNLSNLDKPDIPDDALEVSTVFLPSLDTSSRAKRASEAADMLNTAAGTIREQIDKMEEAAEKPDTSELEELADKLEEDSSELEGIEFPGMYG